MYNKTAGLPAVLLYSHTIAKKLLTNRYICAIIFKLVNLAYRGIVQLVEYRSPKPQVVGSSPTAPATNPYTIVYGFLLITCFFFPEYIYNKKQFIA